MKQIRDQKRKMAAWGRLFAFFCLLAGFSILSGCSRESEGTIYLSGTSMFKITVGSSSGTKDAEALNKTGKPLLEDWKWKGQPETEVLDALVQKMQSEEAKKIYIDVLGTDKGWVAGEIQKLSEFFSEDTYESTIPVEIRSASDLDGSKFSENSGSGGSAEEQRLSLAEESQNGEESGAEESSAQDGTDGEPASEAGMTDESTEDESNPESSTASTTAEESTTEPVTAEPTTAEPTTAQTAAATTAAVPKATAPVRTTAVPRTAAPETAAPATAAPETTVPETAASETTSPETAALETEAPVPETAASSTEGEALNSGNGEASAATRSRNSDVYIPTKTIEDDQSFGPGW